MSQTTEMNCAQIYKPDKDSELKLYGDEETLSMQNLYRDLKCTHDYLNDRKCWSCLQNTQINEILFLIKQIVAPLE